MPPRLGWRGDLLDGCWPVPHLDGCWPVPHLTRDRGEQSRKGVVGFEQTPRPVARHRLPTNVQGYSPMSLLSLGSKPINFHQSKLYRNRHSRKMTTHGPSRSQGRSYSSPLQKNQRRSLLFPQAGLLHPPAAAAAAGPQPGGSPDQARLPFRQGPGGGRDRNPRTVPARPRRRML